MNRLLISLVIASNFTVMAGNCLASSSYIESSIDEPLIDEVHYNGKTKDLKRCIVLDWDDTLFPTKQFREKKIQNRSDLFNLDLIAYDLIRTFLDEKGGRPVFIISSADDRWVRETAKLLPQTNQLICTSNEETGCAHIVSAKNHFNKHYKGIGISKDHIPFYWKVNTFRDYLSSFDEVISIGDGIYEEFAMKTVFPLHRATHISLPTKPKISDMERNLGIIKYEYSAGNILRSDKGLRNIYIDEL